MKTVLLFILISSFNLSLSADNNPNIIYNSDTLTWFGSDFSLFRLTNPKKVGEDDKLKKYITAWNVYYNAAIPNVKMASWLSFKKVFNDTTFTSDVPENRIPLIWISKNKHTISDEIIQNHLLNYTSERTGLGLTFIIESFQKGDPSLVHGYFVWFDIKTKKIISIFKTQGTGRSVHFNSFGIALSRSKNMPIANGMTGYWLNGMIDSTLKFSIDFKDNKPK